MNAPVTDRRALLLGLSLAAAAIVGTAGGAMAASADGDAELIRLCAKLGPMQRAIEAFREKNFNAEGMPLARDESFERGFRRMIRLEEAQAAIVAQTAALPATTTAGLAARARAIAILEPDLLPSGNDVTEDGDGSMAMVSLLLRDLLATEARS